MAAHDDDAALLRAWQRGDRPAGSALVSRYTPLLFEFFANKVSSGAEELVQQTFVDLAAAHQSIEDDGVRLSFRAFAFTIARRRLLNHFRSWRRNGARLDPLEHSVADLVSSPSRAIVATEDARRLNLALKRLPLDAQIVIELYNWQELPLAEIAEVIGTAPGTVKSRLARARDRLRDLVAEGGPLDEDTLESMLSALSSPRER